MHFQEIGICKNSQDVRKKIYKILEVNTRY